MVDRWAGDKLHCMDRVCQRNDVRVHHAQRLCRPRLLHVHGGVRGVQLPDPRVHQAARSRVLSVRGSVRERDLVPNNSLHLTHQPRLRSMWRMRGNHAYGSSRLRCLKQRRLHRLPDRSDHALLRMTRPLHRMPVPL